MDYYGLLFLYYLKGLSGKSVLRLFFNIEAGGTEQLLPENTSTPTTSPILADIQYPDGLRTDQYFTYRETPTTVSNKARIKTIKGNTLVWNQLANTSSGSSIVRDVTLSVDSSGTITVNNQTASSTGYGAISSAQLTADGEVNHVYLLGVMLVSGAYSGNMFWFGESSTIFTVGSPSIVRPTNIGNKQLYFQFTQNETYNFVMKPYVFDLTKMFGEGNEPATVEEFTSLFPSYYAYNAGSLLSFNGTGLKTVGKNQIANIVRGYFNVGATTIGIDNDSESLVFYAISGCTYTASSSIVLNRNNIARCDSPNLKNYAPIYDTVDLGVNMPKVWVATWTGWTVWYVYSTRNEAVENSAQVEFGSTATEYEPYTSSTTSLPISTYFPTGMKSAGTVYDELTPTKAITRIGSVDLGSMNWSRLANGLFIGAVNGMAQNASSSDRNKGIMSSLYTPSTTLQLNETMENMTMLKNNGSIYIQNTSYTDATSLKTAMSGVYLYYELATPTETPITTEDANEALSLLMGKSVSSNNANQLINIITKGE